MDLHGEISVDALPVVVEELVGQARLLVEEDEGAKVRLLVCISAEFKLGEVVGVDMMVWAGKDVCLLFPVAAHCGGIGKILVV